MSLVGQSSWKDVYLVVYGDECCDGIVLVGSHADGAIDDNSAFEQMQL